MPVTTRTRYRNLKLEESTNRFNKTITNPCILAIILEHLSKRDVVSMKQVSKDPHFVDTIDNKMKVLKSKYIKTKNLIKQIKTYLTHVTSLNRSEDKIPVVIKLYDLICKNKWFIKEHITFEKVVHDNLFKNMFQNPRFTPHSIKFLNKLFNLEPPKDFYNSQLSITQYGMYDKYGKFVELPR